MIKVTVKDMGQTALTFDQKPESLWSKFSENAVMCLLPYFLTKILLK